MSLSSHAHRLVPALLLGFSSAHASEAVNMSPLLFGSDVSYECDEPLDRFGDESAALGAWVAKLAVGSAVSLAGSILDKATEASSTTRAATAPGHLYRWLPGKKEWRPDASCIRFWYARQRPTSFAAQDVPDYGGGTIAITPEWKALASRWGSLGFVERPYLYGEVRLAVRRYDSTAYLQPVVLFATQPPEARGLFRKATRMVVALDIKPLGADSAVATHAIELPEANDGPVLVRGLAANSMSSAWANLPPAPTDGPVGSQTSAAPFTALVSFTVSSDGTLMGKTLASTFKDQQDELRAALLPKPKAQRESEREDAIKAAFDAVADVLSAEAALAAGNAASKPQLVLAVKKAQFLANQRLRAAGLPSRYDVSGP